MTTKEVADKQHVTDDAQATLSRSRVVVLAILAAVLTASFYLCLVVLTIGLAAVTALLYSALPVLVIFTIPVWVTLAVVVRSTFAAPNRSSEELSGVSCSRTEQPGLWVLVDGVCDRAGAQPPDAIQLTFGGHAAAFERGGIRAKARQRVLVLPLAYVQALSENELSVVVAHEIGHFAAGDTMLLRWLMQAHRAIERSLAQFETQASVLRHPFRWYAKTFFAITARISRRSEIAADAFSAALHGSEQTALTLRRAAHLPSVFDAYWRQEIQGVLDAGFRPPLTEGFGHFLTAPEVARAIRDLPLDRDTGLFDSHPSTVERLSRLDVEREADVTGGTALALVDRPEDVELALLCDLADEARSLQPISWPEVARRAYRPIWERSLRKRPGYPPGSKVADVAELAAACEPATPGPYADPPIEAIALGAALALTLCRQGWEPDALPGHPVVVRGNQSSLQPFEEVLELVGNESARAGWVERCADMGIADLSLEDRSAAAEQAASDAPAGGSIGEAIELSIQERQAKIVGVIGAALLLVIALPFPVLLLLFPFSNATLTEQIVIRGLGGFCVAGILGFLIRAVVRAKRRRPRLVLDDSGVTVIHDHILRQPFVLPREEIRVISVDAGEAKRLQARFPVYQDAAWVSHEIRASTPRGWIWENGCASVPVFGLTKATPNLLIVLRQAIPGPRVRRESLHGPLNEEWLRALLVRLDQPDQAVPPLRALGLLRPLTVADFGPPASDQEVAPDGIAPEPPLASTPS